MAAGTADGKVALFDLRSSRPVVVKDHMYGTAITSIAFHSVAGGLGGSGEVSVGCAIWDLTCFHAYGAFEDSWLLREGRPSLS